MRRLITFQRLLARELIPPLPSAPDEENEVLVISGDYTQIRDYSLVLASQEIEHRLKHSNEGPFEIFVPIDSLEKALEQISLYQAENPPRPENPPLPMHWSLQPLWILMPPTLITLLQFSSHGSAFYHTGIADAEKILNDDWWRVFTALTLHGDARHLASNLISGYVILNLLSFRLPLSRIAISLVAASGLANFLVALTVQNDFRSLGFSTFVFASLGALSSMEFRLIPKNMQGLLRRFAPLFGAASLAVFLGLGENSDILAHFYGFILGLFCGFIPRQKNLLWGTPLQIKDGVLFGIYFGVFGIVWKVALF
jgi:membrane associated rhomboid family serine protease